MLQFASLNYWDNYYKKNSPQTVPWTGVHEVFFDKVWEKYDLPKSGSILDVGCGRGDKAFYFANKGYYVWAFDIAKSAVKEAEKASINKNPVFFVRDATKIGDASEIKDVRFDIVLDLVTSQFLDKESKTKYLKGLKKYLKTNQTYYLLTTFIKKDGDDPMDGYAEWVKKIAQSPKDLEEIYMKYFEIIGQMERETPKGKVGTFILRSI